jgi:hypothetical protein
MGVEVFDIVHRGDTEVLMTHHIRNLMALAAFALRFSPLAGAQQLSQGRRTIPRPITATC